MSLAQQLTEYISPAFAGLWVQSHEHDDALAEIAKLCRDNNWKLFQLDADQARPKDDKWTGAEIRACCRLAALLDLPLTAAA